MALLFMDGFDHYATADAVRKYTIVEPNGATFQINSSAGRRGTGAFLARASSGGGTNSRLSIEVENSETIIVGFAFRINTTPTANSYILSLLDGTTLQAGVVVTPAMKIALVGSNTILPDSTSSTTLATNTFYYIEAKIKISNSVSPGECVLRINGVEEASATSGDTQVSANAYANRVRLGIGTEGGFAHTGTFDDYYVCNTSGSVNNNFLGDCRVDVIRPNADGFYGDGTPSSGSDRFAVVNDTTPNTTDFVTLSDIGDRDSYEFQDLTPLSTRVVYGVQTLAAVAKDDGGTRQVAALARSGATDSVGPDLALSVDYRYARHLLQTDPNTSGLWTQSSVNNAEFGVEVTG
jgi:hypothetical protein